MQVLTGQTFQPEKEGPLYEQTLFFIMFYKRKIAASRSPSIDLAFNLAVGVESAGNRQILAKQ